MQIDPDRSLRDYLTAYKADAVDKEVAAIVACLGVDSTKLIALMNTHITEVNLNEFGRFDDLRATADQQKAKAHFESKEGQPLQMFKVNIKASNLLNNFLLHANSSYELLPQWLTAAQKWAASSVVHNVLQLDIDSRTN